MTGAAKVAISLDAILLDRVEALRVKTGETRSALIARALRNLLKDEQHQQKVRLYVEAYRQTPETTADVETARTVSRRTLANLDWNES